MTLEYSTNNYTDNYTNNEHINGLYAFEIKIVHLDGSKSKYKILTFKNMGYLVSVENNIKKIKISIVFIDTMDTLTIKKQFNETLNNYILYKNNVIIRLNYIGESIKISYKVCN
jgi:hypothetical protein